MQFSEKLRKLRTEAGLSQEALADIVCVSRSAIAKYEGGKGMPSGETLRLLANYFKVEVDDLLSDPMEDKKEEHPHKPLIGLILLISGIAIGALGALFSFLYYLFSRFSDPASIYNGAIYLFIGTEVLSLALILTGYLLRIVHTGKRKTVPTLLATIPFVLYSCLGAAGFLMVEATYTEYHTFTSEKWIAAKNDKESRAAMVDSFLLKYDIKGFGQSDMETLLGTPDDKGIIYLETYPVQYGGMVWSYSLGRYGEKKEDSNLEITFTPADKVDHWNIYPVYISAR